MKTFLAIIGVLAMFVIGPMWHGYVLSITWGWFVAPTFGVARLSVPAAIGISAIVGFMAKSDTDDDNKPSDDRWKMVLFKGFAKPAIVLLFCWIVKHWM